MADQTSGKAGCTCAPKDNGSVEGERVQRRAEFSRLRGHRERWTLTMDDGRNVGRRMRLSWHPSEGVVVLSLWQGAVCKGTFRLPVKDAPRLIAELAEALGNTANRPVPGAQRVTRRKSVAVWWRHWLQRLRSDIAEIVNLSERRRL